MSTNEWPKPRLVSWAEGLNQQAQDEKQDPAYRQHATLIIRIVRQSLSVGCKVNQRLIDSCSHWQTRLTMRPNFPSMGAKPPSKQLSGTTIKTATHWTGFGFGCGFWAPAVSMPTISVLFTLPKNKWKGRTFLGRQVFKEKSFNYKAKIETIVIS